MSVLKNFSANVDTGVKSVTTVIDKQAKNLGIDVAVRNWREKAGI